ncbi:MAG TPA: hypothetical protein VLJ19_14130 [Variovorax sp.]|nr:hypothetical protein [Variovorax sp.]
MEFLIPIVLLALGAYLLNTRLQRRRVALLGTRFRPYQVEKLMEQLTDGYLRCLDEDDATRREQIWRMLDATEATLADQFQRFAADFARVDEGQARVSKLLLAIPYADRLFPAASFDVRKVFQIHALGIAAVAANRCELSARDKAFTMSAELFLMQHTCHWYCRSMAVASARLMARHKISYALVLDSVSPDTRTAYRDVVGY